MSKNSKNVARSLPTLEEVLAGARPWKAKELGKAEGLAVRRYYVDLLRMDGRNPLLISRFLGIPTNTVYRDVEALEAEESIGDLAMIREQKRAEVYKRVLGVISKAEDHRRRALDPVKISSKSAKQADGKKTGEVKDIERPADLTEANRALGIQLDAIDKLEELFGLKINKLEHTGAGGGAIQVQTRDPRLDAILGAASDDRLRALVDLLGGGAGGAGAGGRGRTPAAGR